ncbi:SAM-dependent methyltransferase [Aphanothece hegewaldii CCALA 016]|uniref:SAM-dependent methyltransferase n=1 Tax=Aphanothece hegewaldii CCALA 016 TaxID=2107694 RepID=A0A2T1LWL3_9CHRO|nr:class I SAM-dependent methyltransferase [Aphanothece hegewaldii]PSF36297.1 SAM-dependent methyltransferase [Aphanothece hegewaldii CCALA 016]
MARPVTPLGILAKTLESIVQKIDTTDTVLKDELCYAYQIASGLDPYLEDCTTPDSEPLRQLVTKTQQEEWGQNWQKQVTEVPLEQEMLSGHVEGQTLKMFVRMTQATRILEIGMFTGYSALAMAEALPEHGQVVACEVDPYVAQFAQHCFDNSPHGHKIKVKVAPALLTMRQLSDMGESFDFVFIDADKGGYIDYFNFLLETNLLAPNGIICVDNTLLQGEPYLSEKSANGSAIAQFNRHVANDPRVEQVLLPLRDGLTIIRRV